jgi:hypothetical protein
MNKPRGKTGPTTEAGKQISSRNAAKHNCTSTSLIVKGEDAAAFTTLLESLTAEYQPETQGQQITVNEAARAAWELARAHREFDKSQSALYREQENMRDWNPTQQSEFERMLRYRTRAERAYGRALKAAEYLRKLHLQAQQRVFWENLQQEHLTLAKQRLKLSATRIQSTQQTREAAKEKNQPAASPKWPTQIAHLSQVIEIRIIDGTITIEIHPQADDMHLLADHSELGAQVLRRFEFPDGVPAEYAWVNGPGIRRCGIVWEQHFWNVDQWRAHVAREGATPGRYLPKVLPESTP